MSEERLLHRPIYGGVFGEDGRYALASMPCVSRGLYATRYMVVQPQAGVVLSVSEDKVQALALARLRLHAANDKHQGEPIAAEQAELWPDQPLLTATPAPAPYISRRRRAIYEHSHGHCHYCGTPLDLTGKWHVEHQLPRALGGGDDTLNLVAACVPCNLTKSDSTAIEFVTRAGRAN
ncbi:HNH endonuclease [Caenimonas soli]|uniref:HNH endonuclease n=1 Tax=Caenimonas soli TaxID=2735555 RepID=UPI00155559C8|nr:HNH endonuclease [Caenimonas soli]